MESVDDFFCIYVKVRGRINNLIKVEVRIFFIIVFFKGVVCVLFFLKLIVIGSILIRVVIFVIKIGCKCKEVVCKVVWRLFLFVLCIVLVVVISNKVLEMEILIDMIIFI